MTAINEQLIAELEQINDTSALLKEVFKRFKKRAAIGTSGQLTGVALIDLAVRAKIKPRIFTIDTLRLFPETYELFGKIEKKYKIKIEKIKPDPVKIDRMIKQHGEYLFFDTPDKQKFCCHLRKVEPNNRVLETLDVWITGLRSDQSATRADGKKFQIITGPTGKPILKIAPLFNWTEKDLRDYIAKYKVPMHKLLSWNENGWYYESLGCILCTTPIGPHEPRRAGRWRWFNQNDPDKKECGLHVNATDNTDG
ncbi:phosphoadenylyl-sulfate reductase [bacterium]|nr:phosphoadenylyl-sulfate reductase [bacterium]